MDGRTLPKSEYNALFECMYKETHDKECSSHAILYVQQMLHRPEHSCVQAGWQLWRTSSAEGGATQFVIQSTHHDYLQRGQVRIALTDCAPRSATRGTR